jgi:hypothetical protein
MAEPETQKLYYLVTNCVKNAKLRYIRINLSSLFIIPIISINYTCSNGAEQLRDPCCITRL